MNPQLGVAVVRRHRLAALRLEFQADAQFGQVFVVLTVGSSLIATLGLLANSAAVVIGAMVVAPWILPLQAMAFQVLRGRLPDFLQALRTLLLGVVIGLGVSVLVGSMVALPSFGDEVIARTDPNLLDLGVALAAGGVAMFAKLRKEAISALAGLAIAVALVPPICVAGLSLSAGLLAQAVGAFLLFLTNLLGILSGAMVCLAVLEQPFRGRLLRSRLGLTSLGLTALLVLPLGGSFLNLLARSRQSVEQQKVRELVELSLRNETLTLGRDAELQGVTINWETNPPVVTARVSVSDPQLPSPKQVEAVQAFINTKLAPQRFRLVVQRTAIEVVGPEPAPNPPEVLPFWLLPPLPPIPEPSSPEPSSPDASAPSPPAAGSGEPAEPPPEHDGAPPSAAAGDR